jgi:hypothetical protein
MGFLDFFRQGGKPGGGGFMSGLSKVAGFIGKIAPFVSRIASSIPTPFTQGLAKVANVVGLFIKNNLTGSRELVSESENWINENFATNDIQVSLSFNTENGYITIQGMAAITNFLISDIIHHEPFTLPVGLVKSAWFR